MRPLTFALMLLAQRVDDALSIERLKRRPDPHILASLRQRKKRLGSRLLRSLRGPQFAEG